MRRLLIIILCILSSIENFAQTELTDRWDAMMAEAKEYAAKKEYVRAIECNETAIKDMEAHGVDGLSVALRNSNAIYYIYMGVPLLKSKEYKEAEAMFEKAIVNARPMSKTMNMAHTYLADVYSSQSLGIRQVEGDLMLGIALSKKAEEHYDLANAPERHLKEQLNRATMLKDVMKVDEASILLRQIIEECEGMESRDVIRGEALSDLGCIEQDAEDFQNAIKHLEEGYDILMAHDKRLALLPAIRLAKMYKVHIPDDAKASFWNQKVEKLKQE